MRRLIDTKIHAVAIHKGDMNETKRLYRIFCERFDGNFWRIVKFYGWRRAEMLRALRQGQK